MPTWTSTTPIAWCQDFDGGRSWYGGRSQETFVDQQNPFESSGLEKSVNGNVSEQRCKQMVRGIALGRGNVAKAPLAAVESSTRSRANG